MAVSKISKPDKWGDYITVPSFPYVPTTDGLIVFKLLPYNGGTGNYAIAEDGVEVAYAATNSASTTSFPARKGKTYTVSGLYNASVPYIRFYPLT